MINSTLYIFGNFGGGFTQYPADYTKGFLATLASQTDAKTMLAIHRDNNLMYYCYLRRLENDQYIGFCVLLNALMFSNIKELFHVFENAITFMVTSGGIIGFNSEGEIIAAAATLLGKEKDIDSAFSYIQSDLSKLETSLKKLPPVSYGISKTETKTFSVNDDNDSIVDSSHKYGYTFVAKDKGFVSATLSGYKGVIVKLNKEKKELAGKYEELNTKYQKTVRQKKQIDKIVFLLVLLIGLGAGLLSLNSLLNTTQSKLTDANNSIRQKNSTIKEQQNEIAYWKNNYNQAVRQRDGIERDFSEYQSMVADCQPFLFKSSSFNFNTCEYTFRYYGLADGYKTVTVRVIYPDGTVRSSDYNIYISKGENSAGLSVNGYFYNSNYYVFEIIYDGKVIGGGRH